jgi:hypothetical protein
MQLSIILLISAALTGGIVYGIYHLTRSRSLERPLLKAVEDLDFPVEEKQQVLTERKSVVKDAQSSSGVGGKIKNYPDCFGTKEKYSSCKRDCAVSGECASTINVLEGF